MDESKLEAAKLKSLEVRKGDDSLYTFNVTCSLAKNDEISEEKRHRESSLNLAEVTCNMPSDNCSIEIDTNEEEKKEYVNKKLELIISSSENVDCFDDNRSKGISQRFKNVQEMTTDYQNSPEYILSFTYTDIPVTDFNSLPKTVTKEAEKPVQDSEHVDTASDRTCNCMLRESKNRLSEIATETAENDKDVSSPMFSFSSDGLIGAGLENEVISGVIPIFGDIVKNTSPSTNNYRSNINENTDSVNVLEEVERTIAAEKIQESVKRCSFRETDNLNLSTAAEERKYKKTEEISENNKDCDRIPLFINSNTSKSDNNIILINENHKANYRTDLTVKVNENKFPHDVKLSDVSKCNMTENKLKTASIEEEYTRLLVSKDITHLHPSEYKVTKENGEKSERAIPTKVEISENVSKSVDNSDAVTSVCERKIVEDMFHSECDASFSLYINSSATDINIKDKKNCEATKETVPDDKNSCENLYYTDFGNIDLNNTLKQKSVTSKSDNMTQKFDEAKCCFSEFCHCSADNKIKTENNSHMKVTVNDEDSKLSSDSAISQTHETEVTMEDETRIEHSVPFNENEWDILSSSDCFHTDEDKDMQQNIKSETVEKNSEKYFEELFCHNLDDYEVVNNLSDRKASKEKDFYASLNTTVNNCVSSLMRCDLLNINKYIKYIFGTENKMANEGSKTNVDEENTPCRNFIHSPNIISENWSEKGNVTKYTHVREVTVPKSCKIESDYIKTLENALHYFNLWALIDQLEVSLEDVRRHRKIKDHEVLLKDVDKRIQKLSFKYHPDRIRNKGGSEEEIQVAEKLQAAINAVRTALNILSEAFLEDLDTDHKYGFYTKLELSSLANENEVKSHIYEVLFKIGLLSEIKQQKIIAQIQKFLNTSQNCIQSYFECNIIDFEKHRDFALLFLKSCISGYKKLNKELEVIENECKDEKLDNICCNIRRMIIENQGTLTLLQDLKRVARKSLAGSFQIFTFTDIVDEYFVLPFIYYVNVILMCSVMINNGAKVHKINALESHLNDFRIFKINGISFSHPYLLILSFIEEEQRKWLFKENISQVGLKQEFDKYLACFNDYLQDKFKVCDYAYGSTKNYLSEELKKCMKMMNDFQTKEKELSKNIEKFKSKIEEKDEKYEKIMRENEELNQIVKEQIEKSKKLSERISLAISEND